MIALHNLKYRISLLFITAIIFIIALLPIGVGNTALAQINIKNAYEDSNVLDDLQSSSDFNLSDYPYNENLSARCINFAEFCYAVNKADRKEYGLYLYIYNPSGKQIRDSGLNKAQLATSYDDDGKPNQYDKFTLKLCSSSTGEQAYKFYKFRVIDKIGTDGQKIEERVSAEARRYDLSGFELLYRGDNNATEYTAGGSYTFTGFATGYGADKTAASTLNCAVTKLDTVKLDVTHYTYRSDMDNPNMTHHNQVDSVYFSVPKEIRSEYDELQRVRAEWYEYRTTPIIVTNDYTLGDYLLSYAGVDIGVHDSSKTYSLGAGKVTSSPGYDYMTYYDWSYNIEQYTKKYTFPYYFTQESKRISTMLAWVFKTNSPGESVTDNYRLPAERLIDYIHAYQTDKYIDDAQRYPSDLFTTDVGVGRTAGYNNKNFDAGEGFNFNEYSPSSSTYSFWQSLKSAFGWKPEQDDVLTGLSPIHELEADDFSGDVAKKLLIHDGEDLNNLRSFYNIESAKGNAVFVFHFACTEYYADMLEVTGNSAQKTDTAFVAEENVFLDFDILELTFTKDGKYFVIPAVMSPVDLIADIVGPIVPDNTPYWLKVVMIIGVVIAAIIAVYIIYKIVYFVIDAITDLFIPSYSSRGRRR